MSRILASITVPAALLEGVPPGALEQDIQARIHRKLQEHMRSEVQLAMYGTCVGPEPVGRGKAIYGACNA